MSRKVILCYILKRGGAVKTGTFKLDKTQTGDRGSQERLEHLIKIINGAARQALATFGPKMVKPHLDHRSWQEPRRLSCDYSAAKRMKAGAQRKVGGWTTKLKGKESRSYREESKGILMVNHTHKCRSHLTRIMTVKNSCVTTKRDGKSDKKEGKHQRSNSSKHQKERNSPNPRENEETEAQQEQRGEQ